MTHGKKKGPKPTGKKKGVLSDHRREGKRFIPPLLDLPVRVDNYWRDVGIPELIWIALLIQRHGLRDGADLAATLAKGAMSVRTDKKKWFAKATNFAGLSSAQREALATSPAISERIGAYRGALAPLNTWYPESPFAFLGAGADLDGDLGLIKEAVAHMYDKTEVRAMKAQTTAIYVGFVTGMLFIRKGMILGELELINEYPKTERSEQFGASVRASINALIQGPDGADRTWANSFWQRGFVLEPCVFPEIDHD
jgi:hypothetical protein